jgi:hypothetical protein
MVSRSGYGSKDPNTDSILAIDILNKLRITGSMGILRKFALKYCSTQSTSFTMAPVTPSGLIITMPFVPSVPLYASYAYSSQSSNTSQPTFLYHFGGTCAKEDTQLEQVLWRTLQWANGSLRSCVDNSCLGKNKNGMVQWCVGLKSLKSLVDLPDF